MTRMSPETLRLIKTARKYARMGTPIKDVFMNGYQEMDTIIAAFEFVVEHSKKPLAQHKKPFAQHEPYGDDPVEWIARLQRPLFNSHFRDDDRAVIEIHLTRLRTTLLRLRESRMNAKP